MQGWVVALRGAVAGVGGVKCDRSSVARDAGRDVLLVVLRADKDEGRPTPFFFFGILFLAQTPGAQVLPRSVYQQYP